jgi:hypothetical protein
LCACEKQRLANRISAAAKVRFRVSDFMSENYGN